MMTRKEFEKSIATAFDKLPDWIKDKMKNVAITIEDVVDPETMREMKLESDMELLGLYRGVPQIARENAAGISFPDNITLFMLPILDEANISGKSAEKIIFETLWHEIAHHFGLSEKDVERREREEFCP
jgi:predicted Zn-dependent protease with MMP-like domain